jgi:hypothetical protein
MENVNGMKFNPEFCREYRLEKNHNKKLVWKKNPNELLLSN